MAAEGGDDEAGDEAAGLCHGLDLCRETEDTYPSWVFWDVESCPCPLSKLDVADMFPKIKSILREWGFRGPVEMIAVGSAEMFSHPTATDLTNTGVIVSSFIHEEHSRIASQAVGAIEAWLVRTHPPANILFIADRCFPAIVEEMCQRNYNVLVRHSQCRSPKREVHRWNRRADNVLLQQQQCRVRERENYCWSWVEVLEGRPEGNLKRSRDNGGPSLSEAKRLAL